MPDYEKDFGSLAVGDIVQAKRRVYDLPGDGFGPPHPRTVLKYPTANFVHAEKGELGTVVDVEGSRVTVRFDRTGTVTDVVYEEVEHVPTDYTRRVWCNVLRVTPRGRSYFSLDALRSAAADLGYFYFSFNGCVRRTNDVTDAGIAEADFFV